MPRYLVSATLTISVHTKVEASSRAEAVSRAMEHEVVGLCFQCGAGDPRVEWITSGELDGEPRELRAEIDVEDADE